MSSLKEKIYQKSPHCIQNLIITVFNVLAYQKRYSGKYKAYLKQYQENNTLSLSQLQKIQAQKYEAFVQYAIEKSPYYREVYKNIENPHLLENIRKLPILKKEDLRSNINKIHTIPLNEAVVSKTGGTTGKSLEVYYQVSDIKERFAILDNFRGNFGYQLGKKTAWFSGKNLLSDTDLQKNRFWKTDYYYKVRYYSTFHIHAKFLEFYVNNLIKYAPEFMIGFPSTMYEIAKYGMAHDIEFPANTIKAIFPTAETVTHDIRTVLESYFKTRLYNQYASSEGAPFIIECKNGNLHLELQSGVYEVLNEKDEPATNGRLVVTSFNTHGTPLIRYDIGDQIELSSRQCDCGNQNPLVEKILGRISDYIFSEETGKINLGNISNCLKGVKGVLKFQIQQYNLEELIILIERDVKIYTRKDETIFIHNLKDRVGKKMELSITYVDEIPVEKSGKYRIIKNELNC